MYGQILEKHKQVGNAVPPPMGRAIGIEILKAYAASVGHETTPSNEKTLAVDEVKEKAKEENEEDKPSKSEEIEVVNIA